ncbi:MAG TPA: hypothetical protein V6C89_03185 [Drouetiella sp.]
MMKSQWSGNDVLIAGKPTSPRPGFDEDNANPLETPTIISSTVPTPPLPGGDANGATSSAPNRPYRRKYADKSNATSSKPLTAPSSKPLTATSSKPLTATSTSTASASSSEASANSADKPEPINPRILLVPGQSVARMNLGMTSAEVLNLLGKPTYSSDNVVTYWTSDRRYFLSVLLKAGIVSEIAFNSPAFKTANMISLSNYTAHAKQFSAPANSSVTLLEGGFSVTDRGKDLPVGVIFKKRAAQAASGWWDTHAAPPSKPSHPAQN